MMVPVASPFVAVLANIRETLLNHLLFNCPVSASQGVNGTLVKVPYCIVSTYTKPYINKAFPYEAAAACDANPDCKAFSRSTPGSGGTGGDALLKTAAGPTTYQEGAVTFIKA
jgi:hypothetical protein